MDANNNKVIIVVKGGVVQSIYSSNTYLNYEVLDFDNEELDSSTDEENILKLKTEGLEAVL